MTFINFFTKLFKARSSDDHTKDKTYEEKIENVIKANKELSIKEIRDLKCEANSNFYYDKTSEIISLVKNLDFKKIESQFLTTPKTFEDLTYFSFTDETQKKYVAIIYDSD
jgi:hypothetical protein